MPPKIAVVGAGSIGFTRRLVQDLLTVPEFDAAELAFTDISRENLDRVTSLIRRDIRANKKHARIRTALERRRAIAGAQYILSLVRVGGLRAFRTDIEIPLKYGVDQCVGDTLGPGGILYGQRGIPVLLGCCKDIRETAATGALLLNYSNPMAMLTWACNKYGGVNTAGLCHGVEHGCRQIADALGLPLDELDFLCAGINHQTWYLSVRHRGIELREKLLPAFERHPVYSKTEKVRIDLLRRLGYYITESNGHISEYLPWYRKRRRELRQWIDTSVWIHGQTGGYLRACIDSRNAFTRDFKRMLKAAPALYTPDNRSTERASYIIEAMETGRPFRSWFNVVNGGCITNLPPDCVVEVPGYADRSGINPVSVGELPLPCAATCLASVNVQRMAVEAAVHGDVDLLKQAVLHDPLTGAVCNPPEVWQLVDEMLAAQAQWLPQYRRAVAVARRPNQKRRYPARTARQTRRQG